MIYLLIYTSQNTSQNVFKASGVGTFIVFIGRGRERPIMLTLKNIFKDYGQGDTVVHALKGVSLNFRNSEFVSVLGPSGCGKTTMLNIIGGLDKYTDGDLKIEGKSTKDFTDRDWDDYRNHSIGFVFQSYNLIPHQSVIKNVELALTLSGVPREKRTEKALKALESVGLKDQAKKMPNQLSGGQMQRVAIARAIVNDPEIILADEPTGALDSETSVQVMEILSELSKTRLVIMVTHNEALAYKYSSRIINLFDGKVIGDTLPYAEEDFKASESLPKKQKERSSKKASMSLLTAFSLSLNNLLSKKARTILTSIAGSVGIIGIALILSLSTGFNAYIQDIQRDTLANYPVTISSQGVNPAGSASIITGMLNTGDRGVPKFPDDDKVTSQNLISDMVTNFAGMYETNDLTEFSKYLKEYTATNDCSDIISAISYTYGYTLEIYSKNAATEQTRRLYPLQVPKMSEVLNYPLTSEQEAQLNTYYEMYTKMLKSQTTFSELIDNQSLITEQYDLLSGKFAAKENEAVLVVDSYNQVSDLDLYNMGLMNDNDIRWIFYKMMLTLFNQTKTDEEIEEFLGCKRSEVYYNGVDFSKIIGTTYKVATTPDRYKRLENEDGSYAKLPSSEFGAELVDKCNFWTEKTTEEFNAFINSENTRELKIVGVLRLKRGVSAGCLTGSVCYTPALSSAVKGQILASQIVKDYLHKVELDKNLYFNVLGTPQNPGVNGQQYAETAVKVGYFDENKPSRILIYPTSFEAKNSVVKIIDEYNARAEEKYRIKYTDYMGLMMESITTIINAVTYVLIAFVSISLLVSSIMIGVITYISVIERTKEIGVLRSVGASKRDISRMFIAETFIIGLAAGLFGILLTIALNFPINLVITGLSGLTNVAALPVSGAFILIGISVLLTVLSGLIPAKFAAKRDPVIALRSE